MTEHAAYSFYGLSNPNFAIQINSGHYIVSDFGNNRVVEINETLSAITRIYNIASPVFLSYSEENETLLITSESLNAIYEITWSDLDLGTLIWQSNIALNSPQSASYKFNDVNKIIISDTGNNRIIKYDKETNLYQAITYYKLSENDVSTIHEISSFYMPFRSYWYANDNICVIEKEGRKITFETIESSSSSSSSSSIDSSSSSSSSSSSL